MMDSASVRDSGVFATTVAPFSNQRSNSRRPSGSISLTNETSTTRFFLPIAAEALRQS